MTKKSEKLRAIVLSFVIVVSAGTVVISFSGSVAASANIDANLVSPSPVAPDDNITVTGDASTQSDLTFLIEDPADDDYAVVKKPISSTDYSVDIDLSNLNFGDGLDNGEATIKVDQHDGYISAEDSATFTVDGEAPTVSIDSPSDGGSFDHGVKINGTASDNEGLKKVEVEIQNESGDYYQGGGNWGSQEWLSTTGTSEWEYNASGLTGDSYTVSVRAEDKAGNVRSYDSGPTSPHLEIEYSTDATAPTINSFSATKQSGSSPVEVGDTVDLSANVTDGTNSTDTVNVNASSLGGSDSESLTPGAGDEYTASFVVSSPSVGDGDVSLTVTATDTYGNNATKSDTVTLETEIATVQTLSTDHDFIGIVDDSKVRVTGNGVQDAQGFDIAAGPGASTESATVKIAGQSYDVTVSDGNFSKKIDPTKIQNGESTGEATVSLTEANSEADTADVTLVHEAQGLNNGYQVAATPMDAKDVRFQYVDDAITYDPTATGNETSWIAPDETQAGSGYYANGINDSARIGYTFESDTQVRAVTLHEGYNLVGATPDINDGTDPQLNADLGGVLEYDDTGIDVYDRDTSVNLSDPSGKTDVSAYNNITSSQTIGEYEGYFIYVEDGEEARVIESEEYDSTDGT